ncbi:MAG: UDP-N-acetylmuramoyl-L-alanyl-D-glutamate--2,6-diaminopimelate ligase, partial [Muribaculaceae bacterium]|nr:UDP-N-acetylmuramoyl-L-alanyl-D-glutamate--2,6-diaminopimelate ligase [Muribaculaceae bacterium]
MKTLKQLLEDIKPCILHGPADREISGITADSRQAAAGSLFVAVRGTVCDAHRFIPDVMAAGVSAIVCATDYELPADTHGVTFVQVADTAEALGCLASAWHGHPSRSLTLVGVTGTNGKTTIATLLYDMARMRGQRAGLISTVVNRVDDEAIASTHTTPDPLELNALLARMVEAGCTFAAMEVSSHACAQKRIAGLNFSGGVFTNLTRDHLDYHKTFQAYLEAKKMFFDALPADAFALVNADDSHARILVQNTRAKVCTYSLRSAADFRGTVVENHIAGMLLRV